MAAYEFASQYFRLKDRYEKESEDAEDLLQEMTKLLGEEDDQEGIIPSDEFDEY